MLLLARIWPLWKPECIFLLSIVKKFCQVTKRMRSEHLLNHLLNDMRKYPLIANRSLEILKEFLSFRSYVNFENYTFQNRYKNKYTIFENNCFNIRSRRYVLTFNRKFEYLYSKGEIISLFFVSFLPFCIPL